MSLLTKIKNMIKIPVTESSMVASLGTLVFNWGDRVISPEDELRRIRLALVPERIV